MKPKAEKLHDEKPKPDIYRYHDYRAFLRDWVTYRKVKTPGFSLRIVAKQSNFTVSYLSMVLSGSRGLSHEALAKILYPLGLNSSECSYLQLLRTIAESDSQEVRIQALERLQRFRSYQQSNGKEIEVYRYLSHWYYVAIREMAALEGFKANAGWIQKRIRPKISVKEIEEALEFLKSHGFLNVHEDGSVEAPEKDIDCFGGVFRIAIQQFHREMLSLACDSLSNVPVAERNVLGSTLAIRSEDFDKLKELMKNAMSNVAALGKVSKTGNTVVQINFSAFPLTHAGDRGK